eukprot:6658413-Ditylum_brightwellii.AAC.1
MKKAWRHDLLYLYSLFEEHADPDSDDLTPCLQPLETLRILGYDDKTSVPVGRTTSILATANQLTHALVSSASGCLPQASDQDWHSKAETVTVIHSMNRDADPSSLMYSGGVDRNGHLSVSVHSRTLDQSIEMKHSAHYCQYLLY